jgi:hypothetical protein
MSTTLDEEQQVDLADAAADDTYRSLIERLSRQSVDKHFDAYVDVPWDEPGMEIDPADSRWALFADDPVGSTDWYQSLPAEQQSAIGLQRVVSAMKIGVEFESVLKRGLLEFAAGLPNGSPEFRYVYHEVIEEAQHSLMFQEFVNRSGYDPPGLPWDMRLGSRFVVRLARWFPELFFLFVLGGEDPIDHTQRRQLRQKDSHPLLERIMRIHVTEEARHLSFARHYLRREIPELSRARRFVLSVATPRLLGEMSRQMLLPSKDLVTVHGMPAEDHEAVARSDEAQEFVRESVAKVRRLCVELGLVTPLSRRIWKRVGLWEEPAKAA